MTGEEFASKRSPAEKKEDMILKEYLAGLKLQVGEKEELLLPDEAPPADFHLTFNRCCRRTVYPDGDFTIIRSNEMIYRMDGKDQDNVETVCITLLYKNIVQWNKLVRAEIKARKYVLGQRRKSQSNAGAPN